MKRTTSWYSIIISLLLIAFIIVLTTWIFRLVINEMKSNRVMWDYLKSYAWAESAQELALLDIKKKWYWYVAEVKANKDFKSKLLKENFPEFNINRDVLISYYNDGKVNSYDWVLRPLQYDIIPLFYIDDNWEKKTNNVVMDIKSWVPWDLSWNVVWDKEGISWIWENLSNWTKKSLTSNGSFGYDTISIWEFLKSSSTNYLVLFNSWESSTIEYTLKSTNLEEFFTKPRLDIYSTWEIWEYKQNLKTNVDNTEFLSILKYSIYSN
jgi:hypothetical protein